MSGTVPDSRASQEADRIAREQGQPRAGFNPERLRRAWQLVKDGKVQGLGGSQYRVVGRVEPYYDVDLAEDPACYCLDMQYRGRMIHNQCKHVLACKLSQLDAGLLNAMSDMMAVTMQKKRAYFLRNPQPDHGRHQRKQPARGTSGR